jgi:hypothetical protein
LAYFIEEEFDCLDELLLAENECYRHARGTGVDPLCGRSRSHSCFPGMHAQCWYCGHHYVWGGNGQTEHLMCSNARAWHCWHAVAFSGPCAVQSIAQAITAQLWQIEGLDDQFAQMVAAASQDLSGNIEAAWRKLRSDELQFKREEANVISAVKAMGVHETLQQELVSLQLQKHQLLMLRHQLEHRRPHQLVLPKSPTVLRQLLQEEFAKLTSDSLSFGKLLRQLVPQMHVYAVRLCDGGHLYPRAQVVLNLAGNFSDARLVPGLTELFTKTVTLDLFEPPQRERIRKEAVRLQAEGQTQKATARLIAEQPTATAVQKSLALQQRMDSLGLSDPFVMVDEPPADYPKLRRHQHERYLFQMKEGYIRPQI